MTSQSPLAVVLVSGGLDSLVSAALAREAGFRVLALSVDYNQRHQVELAAARRVAKMLGAERHVVLPLDLRAFGGSALTDDIDVPKDGVGEGIPITYVPARNTIFLSQADIVREGARLGLDMGVSWSCYDPAPGGLHCGLCDSCRLRHKGFEDAGVPDPTAYAVTPPAP